MAGKTSITIDVKEVLARVDQMRNDLDKGLHAVTEKIAKDGEGDMKTNAPWTDQTGNARNGLTGKAVHGGGSSMKYKLEHAVLFFHTMPYGIWLETLHSGKYAILVPVLQRQGPRTMNLIKGIFS